MKIKKLFINRITIYILIGIIIGTATEKSLDNKPSYDKEKIEELTNDDLIDFISTSEELSSNEKEYLYNSDFFKDVLSTINTSNYMKQEYLKRFNNIDIKSFAFDNRKNGFYNPSEPNCLYVAEYNDLNCKSKDTIAHEFVHLCQYYPCYYNLLTEATAEIISNEYFNATCINAYLEEVKITKVLMEIIGPDPIWKYVFTGDFSDIKKSIKPFLSYDEYKDFLCCLQMDTSDNISRKEHVKRLNELLEILYYNMNKCDIKYDLIISLIKNRPSILVRNYFNQRLINEENSYYYNFQEECLSLEEAEKEEHVFFYEDNNRISFNEYCSNISNPNIFYLTLYGEIKDNKYYYKSSQKIYLPTINERIKGKQKTQ